MRLQDHRDPENRFVIREFEPADITELEAVNRLVFLAMLRHVTGPRNYLDDAIAQQSIEPRPGYRLAIAAPDRRTHLIGVLGSRFAPAGPGEPVLWIEIGYAVIPSYQGRGIARAAVMAFVPKILTPETTEIRARADPDNPASIRVLESCGFVQAGPLEDSSFLGDPHNPAHYMNGVLQPRPRIPFRISAEVFR